MKNTQRKRFTCKALLALALLSTSYAASAITVGTDWGDGSFEDINYGTPDATGLAYVTPFLYAEGLLGSPTSIDTTTLLSYDYSVSGLGSNRMQVNYQIRNDDVSSFNDLRFIVKTDPNGNLASDPLGFTDTVNVEWGVMAPADPDNFQVSEFDLIGGLQDSIYSNNGLNGSNSCPGGTCDVDFALQWNLASLNAGEIWNITIALSDDGSSLSSRYLQAISADGVDTSLTFSGTAQVVPVPAAAYLFASGLLGLIGVARRRAI